jgi:hypothetical protein
LASKEGSIVIAEETGDGILIRPAMVVPVERYTPERKAEFLSLPGKYLRTRTPDR